MADYKPADWAGCDNEGEEFVGVWETSYKSKNGGNRIGYNIKIQRPYTTRDGERKVSWGIFESDIPKLIEALKNVQTQIAAQKAGRRPGTEPKPAPQKLSYDDDDIPF